jgi:VWFA-related protein
MYRAALILLVVVSTCGYLESVPLAAQATSGEDLPVLLQAESNFVPVRVVVRNATGQPVPNLRKEDFRLFDRGKEQAIIQFSVERSIQSVSGRRSLQDSTSPEPTGEPAFWLPQRFLVLYFDDLDMSGSEIVYARNAADHYLATNLRRSDRAAIFSSSGATTLDFTADLGKLHGALFSLHPASRLNTMPNCPVISDYQALRVVDQNDDDVYALLMEEASNYCNIVMPEDSLRNFIRGMAERIVRQVDLESKDNLSGLTKAVDNLAHRPGQRTMIFVSSGFLSSKLQPQIDRVVDRALRSQVIISSLDPKGLALRPYEADASRSHTPSDNELLIHQRDFSQSRENEVAGVLAELAYETGGEFFHNNNDLEAGFHEELDSPQVYYTLGFSPYNLKLDGRFHTLKVALTEKHQRLTVRARRGYFAPQQIVPEEVRVGEETQQAIFSQEEFHQLPVEIKAECAKNQADKAEVFVNTHLDIHLVRFRQQQKRNVTTLLLVSAMFDRDGKLAAVQHKQVRVNVTDSMLSIILTTGINVKTTFQMEPGVYVLREIVRDPEDHLVTALNRKVDVAGPLILDSCEAANPGGRGH